jgi:hypothetical protein
MLELITVHFMPSTPLTEQRVATRADRFAREMVTLAIGCVAAVGITLGLYLVAPTELRDGIVTAFLGFDQPISSADARHAHPPLP